MNGLIRKIIIGENPKNAMAYYIGMDAGRNKVSAIVFDEEHLVRYKKNRFIVYVKSNDEEQVMWKVIDEMPTIVEFDLNF
jgi:predicted NBD/HSP70 family sugar kinase